MKPHKFKPGRKIRSVARFAAMIEAGRWIYFRHKPTHPGWARSWQFGAVQSFIRAGYLREAIPTEVTNVRS